MCSHDWLKKKIMGNVSKSKLLISGCPKTIKKQERNLSKAKRSQSPCNVCDVYGDLIGKEHNEAWKKN